uniref:Uncharacterized protein n=1 Tax=Candidatus Kentrum sp. LFY TaxID=2126342 RepID=A0A450UGQ9_9GAMM|nr:MAG: hypothetical protein BECKLFY1418B_GA0070995_102816 [Candidatus Kentron sp. LFY]
MNRLCVVLPLSSISDKQFPPYAAKPSRGTYLGPTLPSHPDIAAADALCQLEAFLKPRIEKTEQEKVTSKSVEDIFEEVRQDRNGKA